MLQKQSISRDQIFYVIVAVGALALIAITISLVSDGRISSFASILPGQAAASEITTTARIKHAESARLNGLAGEYVNLYGSTAWVNAGLSPAMQVEADRLTGIAAEVFNLYGSTARINAGLSPAMQVEADRWSGIAGQYVNFYGSTARVNAGLAPAQKVEAQRWKGLSGQFFNLYGTTLR